MFKIDGDYIIELKQNYYRSLYSEMDQYLKQTGFKKIIIYSSFQKERAIDSRCESFLFECSK